MTDRPDLKGIRIEVVEYIVSIEEYIEEVEELLKPLRGNGAIKFMAVLNRKLFDLAGLLDSIDLLPKEAIVSEEGELEEGKAGFSIDKLMGDKDDKTLERFLKLLQVGQISVESFDKFIKNYGPKSKEEEDKSAPPIERFFQRKKNGK